MSEMFNPLNAELNPICHLLALLGAHHILHVSRIRVKNEMPAAARLPNKEETVMYKQNIRNSLRHAARYLSYPALRTISLKNNTGLYVP
jgi:hypothetical protein